jgi:hypothetical protein
VLYALWSAKGGVGTTTVAAALALLLARRAGPSGAEILLADLAGDLPAVLGVSANGCASPGAEVERGPGLTHWLAAAPDVPADALGRIVEPVTSGLQLLRRGGGPFEPAGPAAAELLGSVLATDPRRVVVDCGRVDDVDDNGATVRRALVRAADRSLLVVRPCFLALCRAVAAPTRPTGVVLVDEPGRSVTAGDVEQALGTPVVARVRVTEHVARAVDAGLLVSRLPRTLVDDLDGAV